MLKVVSADRCRCHSDMSWAQGNVEDDPGSYGRYPVSWARLCARCHLTLFSLTNDGHAILREIDVAHPAAKSMIELSRTQDEEVGDGTTSVIIIGKREPSRYMYQMPYVCTVTFS